MITKTLSHFVLGLIVFIWVVPFVALVSTSLRSETEAKTAGFWTGQGNQHYHRQDTCC